MTIPWKQKDTSVPEVGLGHYSFALQKVATPSQLLQATYLRLSSPCKKTSSCFCARGGTRTHTTLRSGDFKSPMSTIPSLGHIWFRRKYP